MMKEKTGIERVAVPTLIPSDWAIKMVQLISGRDEITV